MVSNLSTFFEGKIYSINKSNNTGLIVVDSPELMDVRIFFHFDEFKIRSQEYLKVGQTVVFQAMESRTKDDRKDKPSWYRNAKAINCTLIDHYANFLKAEEIASLIPE